MKDNRKEFDPVVRGYESALRLSKIELLRAKLEAARNLHNLAGERVDRLQKDLDDARLASQNPDAWTDYQNAISDLK